MPGYSYKLSEKTLRQLKKFDPQTRKRIIQKLDWFCEQDDPLEFAHGLHDSDLGEYRFRVGDWRVVFDAESESKILKVLIIDHRKQVYR